MLRFDQRDEIGHFSRHLPDRLIRSVYLPEPAVQGWSLETLFSSAHIRYVALGRIALVEALRVAGIGAGDSVLLPGLTCLEVLEAVGAHPVFYPVDPELNVARDPGDWPKARAVIAVNYFGFPQPLASFRTYCERHGAVLIEDNAHGFFSRDEDGTWLGTRGDLGILSLRKTLPIPNGGALVIPHTSRFMPPAQEAFDEEAGVTWWARVKRHVRVRAVRGGPTLLRVYGSTSRLMRGWIPPRRFSQDERCNETPLSKPCAALARSLTVVDPDQESERRRELFRAVDDLMTACGARPAFQKLSDGVVPWGYPFFAEGRALQRVRWRLRREGLDCVRWPAELPEAIQREAPAHYTTLWRVSFLWSKDG